MARVVWLPIAWLLWASAACGGRSVEPALAKGDVRAALEVYRAEREHEALRRIAEHVLLVEARASNEEDSARAWALLRGLGAAALPAWSQLEHEPGDHHVERVRAVALSARAALDDAPSRRALRALLAHDDPQVVALAVTTLSAESDVSQLYALAQNPSASVRAAAVQRLAQSPAAAATLDLLSSRARIDPVTSVRASAARALEAQGSAAIATLEALSDEASAVEPKTEGKPDARAARKPDAQAGADAQRKAAAAKPRALDARDASGAERVRAAALSVLARLAPDRAAPRIAALLAGTPSGLSVQVAQDVLANRHALDASLAAAALAHIAHALASKDRLMRERAALAGTVAAARPDARDALLPALDAQLAIERDRPARLLLAIGKQRFMPANNAAELVALAQGQDVVAAQAAAELAPHSRAARERLHALAASTDPIVRATVAVAAAASFDFERAPALSSSTASLRALVDHESRVRAPAAAAVLRGLERLRALTGR